MTNLILASRLFFEAVISFFRLLAIIFRFFVEAPLTALFVIVRSPRGIRKDRWIAWHLARAHRMRRRLTPEELQRLEEFANAQILQTVDDIRVSGGLTPGGNIHWMDTFKLRPVKDLGVRT